MIQQKMVPIALIEPNTGQIEGVPTNPRFIKNDAFKSLVMSIEQDPEMLQLREVILYPLGKKYVAIGGNQRYEACKFLKHKEVPSKILPPDTDAETLKRIIIKDNGSWGANDLDALANEWSDLPLQDWGIDLKLGFPEEENTSEAYTKKVQAPNYETENEKPQFSELFNDERTRALIQKINESKISDEDKQFLIKAAYRHCVFHYNRIADYYANSDREVQELMEESALVIIDFNKSIELGFVQLSKGINDLYSADYDGEL